MRKKETRKEHAVNLTFLKNVKKIKSTKDQYFPSIQIQKVQL